jgi:hypothetical protein
MFALILLLFFFTSECGPAWQQETGSVLWVQQRQYIYSEADTLFNGKLVDGGVSPSTIMSYYHDKGYEVTHYRISKDSLRHSWILVTHSLRKDGDESQCTCG